MFYVFVSDCENDPEDREILTIIFLTEYELIISTSEGSTYTFVEE